MKNVNDSSARYIYRPYITLKNGKRIFAWQYGKKAFKIRVKGS